MPRRPRTVVLAFALGAVVLAGALRLVRDAPPRVAPADAATGAATLRRLAVLSARSARCEPAQGKHALCSASGVRLHAGELWVVMDGAGALVARARVPERGGVPDLGGPYTFTVEAAPEPGGECKALHDLEALGFSSDGGLVVTTDAWQVAWLDPGPPLRVTSCRQHEPLLPSNHGFEAVVVEDGVAHAISENPVDGAYRVYSEARDGSRGTSRFSWRRPECASGSPRISDAVALPGGALVLASCKTGFGRYDYLLGRLTSLADAAPRVAHTTRIENPAQDNLEGIERLADGRLIVINDDSRGDRREADSALWELELPAEERRALGM